MNAATKASKESVAQAMARASCGSISAMAKRSNIWESVVMRVLV